jgi:hypothetical protein
VFHCVHFECPSQSDEDLLNDDGKAPVEGLLGVASGSSSDTKAPSTKSKTRSSSRSTTPQRVQLPIMGPDENIVEGAEDERKVPLPPAEPVAVAPVDVEERREPERPEVINIDEDPPMVD